MSTERESGCGAAWWWLTCGCRAAGLAGLTAGDWAGGRLVEVSVDVSVSFAFRWMGSVKVSGS